MSITRRFFEENKGTWIVATDAEPDGVKALEATVASGLAGLVIVAHGSESQLADKAFVANRVCQCYHSAAPVVVDEPLPADTPTYPSHAQLAGVFAELGTSIVGLTPAGPALEDFVLSGRCRAVLWLAAPAGLLRLARSTRPGVAEALRGAVLVLSLTADDRGARDEDTAAMPAALARFGGVRIVDSVHALDAGDTVSAAEYLRIFSPARGGRDTEPTGSYRLQSSLRRAFDELIHAESVAACNALTDGAYGRASSRDIFMLEVARNKGVLAAARAPKRACPGDSPERDAEIADAMRALTVSHEMAQITERRDGMHMCFADQLAVLAAIGLLDANAVPTHVVFRPDGTFVRTADAPSAVPVTLYAKISRSRAVGAFCDVCDVDVR